MMGLGGLILTFAMNGLLAMFTAMSLAETITALNVDTGHHLAIDI